jgi:hypothetical protein
MTSAPPPPVELGHQTNDPGKRRKGRIETRRRPAGLVRDTTTMSSAARPLPPRDRRLQRGAFEAFLRIATSRLADRASARGLRQLPVRPGRPLRGRGVAADRHPGPEARRLRAAPSGRPGRGARSALAPAWEAMDEHYATGIAQSTRRPARPTRRARRGGLRRPRTAVEEHPSCSSASLTEAVEPGRRPRGPPCGLLDGGTLLYVPEGRQGRGAPVHGRRVSRARAGRLPSHPGRAEEGAEATLVQ